MTIILIKLGYAYLLALALAAAWRASIFGFAVDRAGRCLHPILNAEYGLIFILSLVQIYLCINLLVGSVNPATWWLPFICKQSSLIYYIVALNFMFWRLRTVLNIVPNGKEV